MALSVMTLYTDTAECHTAECYYAKCCIFIVMLNVVMPSGVSLTVVASYLNTLAYCAKV